MLERKLLWVWKRSEVSDDFDSKTIDTIAPGELSE